MAGNGDPFKQPPCQASDDERVRILQMPKKWRIRRREELQNAEGILRVAHDDDAFAHDDRPVLRRHSRIGTGIIRGPERLGATPAGGPNYNPRVLQTTLKRGILPHRFGVSGAF